jgi:predicted enzyme related to lactoylglutathione lyase
MEGKLFPTALTWIGAWLLQDAATREHTTGVWQRAAAGGKARAGPTTRCFPTGEREVLTMADEKLLMVSMAVTEMAKAKAFYAEQWGWSVTNDVGEGDRHWVGLELPGGGVKLTLSTMHENMQPGTMKLYLSTSNVEAAYDALKAKGVEVNDVKNDLYGPGSGVKWFDLSDPDGNRWLVVQP